MLVCSPTGSGKTALTAHMLKTSSGKGMRSWFVCHRRELIKQSMNAFEKEGLRHGVTSAGFPEEREPLVQICSIQTLARRCHNMLPPKLIVWDECHHVAAGSWGKIYKMFPEAFHIGLTATPERLDGKGLRIWFEDMIKGPTVQSLIEQKYLASYKMFAPPSGDFSNVRTIAGDYVKSEIAKVVDKPKITGDAIEHYKKHANGLRAVVFCSSIEHSLNVCAQFNLHGIKAEHVDGETDTLKRDAAIARFAKGETLVLSNVDLFGEGFDLPAIEAAILLRPTKSVGLYLQQVGRSLRPSPGKKRAIILDHVRNCELHGLPDDEREWSLDGRVKRDKDNNSIRICPECYAAIPSGVGKCEECGYVFIGKARPKIEQEDGELREIDPIQMRRERLKEQSYAKTMEDLVQLGIRKGYKNPRGWAKHVFNARQAKKLAGGR